MYIFIYVKVNIFLYSIILILNNFFVKKVISIRSNAIQIKYKIVFNVLYKTKITIVFC